jgi:hypothetical protein
MKTQEINEKLQSTYHKMVDTIESLVEKEGKSLKEAVNIAEEKLSAWQELSKEENQKVSDEVRSDLKSIGETIQGAKIAYKEQFKLDTTYLTDSIWNKLSKAADVGKEEFIAFTNDLKERTKKIRMSEHASEHLDHLQWDSEHDFWLDEIKIWKKDHQTALEKLKTIEASIKKHDESLDEHAQAIQAHQKLDHQHEKVMSNAELDPSSLVFEEDDDKDISMHKQESKEHSQHAELHNTLKKDHRKTMSLVSHLYKEVVKQEY